VTNEKKKETWMKVADAVNAVNPAERKTVEQVTTTLLGTCNLSSKEGV